MTRTLRALLVGVCLNTSIAAQAPAQASFELDALLHSLLQVQDRIAQGDDAALPLQKHLMGLVEASVEEAGSPKNMSASDIRALLIFGIVGTGNSRITDALFDNRMPKAYSKIALAIGTYRKRKRQQALKRFARIPMEEIDLRLRPYVAFAKGNLLAKRFPKKAVVEYNLVRLEAPGTLLEEATLRRLLSLYLSNEKGAEFGTIAREYGQRFIHSPYREQYLKIVKKGVMKLRRHMSLEDIKAITGSMPPTFQASMYLHIVRTAIGSGHMKLATLAVEEIIALAEKNEDVAIDDNQLKVLDILMRLKTDDPLTLYSEVQRVDRSSLHIDDEKLLQAADNILQSILGPIDPLATNSVPKNEENKGKEPKPKDEVSLTQTGSASMEADKKFDSIERFISDTEGRLENIDNMLSK